MSGLLVPSFDDVLRFGGAQPFLDPAMFGRMAGRINGTNGRISAGSDAELDGWTEGTYLVRVRPASLSNNTALLAKTASGSIDGFMLQHSSGGNLQLQRDWSTTDANYITNDTPLVADQWIDVVIVIRNATSGSLSIYAAPLGQPLLERGYGTATNGAGSIGTSDGANNLVVGNRTIATTVAFQGDYALMVAIQRALTEAEVRRLARDPREFIGDRNCWVWGVIGHSKFNNANISGVNLAQNALTANVARFGTGGGSNVPCPGPFAGMGAADHLRRFWAVDVPTGAITVTVGLATETDAALALTARKLRAVGLASETDTPLALTAKKARAVGLATETDAALGVTEAKARTVGLATETDTALTLGTQIVVTVGLATETDTIFAVAIRKLRTVTLATETDAALAIRPAKQRIVGIATSGNAALALGTIVKRRAVGMGTETDTALAVSNGAVIIPTIVHFGVATMTAPGLRNAALTVPGQRAATLLGTS